MVVPRLHSRFNEPTVFCCTQDIAASDLRDTVATLFPCLRTWYWAADCEGVTVEGGFLQGTYEDGFTAYRSISFVRPAGGEWGIEISGELFSVELVAEKLTFN